MLTQEPSATEYFAAICAALDGTDQSRVPQLLALLAIALPAVNVKLLRGQFSALALILLRIISECDAVGSSAEGVFRIVRLLSGSKDVGKKAPSSCGLTCCVCMRISPLHYQDQRMW